MQFQRQPPRLIKKYPNRRLYDTTDSTYITLDELVSRVKGGADVRIVDASTNEDLTQQTLAQMLFDGRGAARFLSVPLLTQLVRLGDDALADFLGHYLSVALELYIHTRRGAQALAPLNPLATLPFAATDALARLLHGALLWPGGPNAFAPSTPPAVQGYAACAGSANVPQSAAVVIPAVSFEHAELSGEIAESAALAAQPSASTVQREELAALREELAALRKQVQLRDDRISDRAMQQKSLKKRKKRSQSSKKK
jgi:polyhydroxyalkanoate synthesis repressor PhaR